MLQKLRYEGKINSTYNSRDGICMTGIARE